MPWKVHKTDEGEEYYENTATGEVTWDRPAELDEKPKPKPAAAKPAAKPAAVATAPAAATTPPKAEMTLQEKIAARRAKVDGAAADDASPAPVATTTTSKPAITATPSPKSSSAPSPAKSSDDAGMSLQDKIAARRRKVDEEEVASPKSAPPPAAAAAAATPPAGSLPAKDLTGGGKKGPGAAPRPDAGLAEPSAKRAPSSNTAASAPPKQQPVTPTPKPPPAAAAAPPPPAGDAEDWITHTTADGENYYTNRRTNETTWDKPRALWADGETMELEGEWLWASHPEQSWVPARVIERLSDGSLQIQDEYEGGTGERRVVKAKDVGLPISKAIQLTNLTSDLVQLDEVHEPGIIDLLRRRYRRDKIYTGVGDILIAINPFKSMPLFTPAIMHQYADRTKNPLELAPHPYQVINASLQDLIEYHKDQSLLISGESGAGKTVTVKICLEFVSEIAGSDTGVEEKILSSNPILEAFGNAKTVRNDNSSRFGKFMEVHLSKKDNYKIIACSVVHYLLEKSRVVAQAEGERNFHIFYYCVQQFPEAEKKVLFLDDRAPETFKYLSQDGSLCALGETHDDVEECGAMRQAFEEMGFQEQERLDIYKAVAAVLHLGDIEFEEFQSTGSKCTGQATAKAASLLGIEADKLEKVLTTHVSQQRDGLMTQAFPPHKAADARNALARHVFGRMFDNLIKSVNKRMDADKIKPGAGTRYIGMLDIFGFEIFQQNSFEQLSINFANEKLQQLFNRHTFTLEERTYQEEGIAFDHITFHDSQPLLTFLGLGDGMQSIKDGVFQILDEQTVIGSGTDEKFLAAITQKHKDKKTLFSELCKKKTNFKVYHYAGSVEYDTTGFVAKNADKLYDNIIGAMRGSTSQYISTVLFSAEADAERDPKLKTQSAVFMKQLQGLEQRTGATFPRYVRCVKPNTYKRAGLFDAPLALQQLRFAGVFEAVSIRKLGFPFRHTHEHFFEYFRPLCEYDHKKWMAAKKLVADGQSVKTAYTAIAKQLFADLVAGPVPDAKDCRFGKTMVLFRAKEHRALEIARLGCLNKAASAIEKIAKGRYVRRHTPELRVAKEQLEAAIVAREEEGLTKEIDAANKLFFKIEACYVAENVRASVRQEKKLKPKLVQILAMDPDQDATFDRMDAIVKEMDTFVAKDVLAFKTMEEAIRLRKIHSLSFERRDMKKRLAQVVEQVPHASCGESIKSLEAALKDGNTLKDKGADSGGESYYKVEAEAARTELSFLQNEVKLIAVAIDKARTCGFTGQVDHVQPGDIIKDKVVQGLPALKQAVDVVAQHKPHATDSIKSLKSLQCLVQFREAALLALDLGEGAQADAPEWRSVEALLRDVNGLEVEGDSFAIDATEVKLISNDLGLRAAVDDVVVKLQEAIREVDDEQLAVALDQARVLKMFEHPDETIRGVVFEADELLPKVRECRAALSTALAEVKEELLRDALVKQHEIGFGAEPGMLGHNVVLKARQLYAWVVELTAEARLASQCMYTEPSKTMIEGCEEIRLQLPELLDPLRALLALPTDRRLFRQRDAAVALGNYRRAVRLDIEGKDVLFSDPKTKENFALKEFAGLKSPDDFSKRFGIHWKRYKDTMLTWYNPMFGKIHTSLTNIMHENEEKEKELNKQACYLFRSVFAVMGDKKVVEVDGAAHEILSQCLIETQLRDEVYCQLMKQLTENPKPESEARGWNLMAMCLATFPPSEKLDNYLECFLRNHDGRTACVLKLHQTRLGGPLKQAPPVEVVTTLRAGAQQGDDKFWMPGDREVLNFTERMWIDPERIDQYVLDWRAVRYSPGSEFEAVRAAKKRNSGGFEVHLGGDAPKLAKGAMLSRMPSIMLSEGAASKLRAEVNKATSSGPPPSKPKTAAAAASPAKKAPPRLAPAVEGTEDAPASPRSAEVGSPNSKMTAPVKKAVPKRTTSAEVAEGGASSPKPAPTKAKPAAEPASSSSSPAARPVPAKKPTASPAAAPGPPSRPKPPAKREGGSDADL